MLSKDEILEASPDFDATDVSMLITAVRRGQRYINNPALFSTLADKLELANGTVVAQQVNAAHTRLQALGVGEASISGGEDAINYSQSREREALINYIIDTLYIVSEGEFDSISEAELRIIRGYGVAQRHIIAKFI